jgi:uncharacterized protein (DUF362 family)
MLIASAELEHMVSSAKGGPMDSTQQSSNLPRREFLRLLARLGSLAGVSLFLKACRQFGISPETPEPVPVEVQASPSAPTLTPSSPSPEPAVVNTAAPEPSVAGAAASSAAPALAGAALLGKVALVVGNDRLNLVPKVIDLLGFNLQAGMDVFLKPNFNSADAFPGSTHIDTLRAMVLKLKELGAGPITVGDRSGMAVTRRVMESLGIFGLAEELGFDAMVLDELTAENWRMISLPGMHWTDGFPMAAPCLESSALVQTCNLKTHRYGGHFSMSLKNSVGMVANQLIGKRHNYMNELHGSPDQRRMIAEINTAYQPALVLLDGVEAFVDGGPDRGTRVEPNVILAGTDRIALDAAGVAILRKFGTTPEVMDGPIFGLEQIARAVELGLGVDSASGIEFITADEESARYAEELRQILAL